MDQATDTTMLEALAQSIHEPMDKVVALYERERDDLARGATITNYISLLAVRRVRRKLQRSGLQSRH
jgi:hypothetical protein